MERNGRILLSKLVWPTKRRSGVDARRRPQARATRHAQQLNVKQGLEAKVRRRDFIIQGLE
eukprot:9478910-Alexandrium_andersonii.AAC.1